MLKATTLRLKDSVYKDINYLAEKEYLDTSSFLRKLVMKSYLEYKLDVSLKEWSEGKKSLGDVSKENNLSIWQTMEEVKKRGLSSNISLEDINNDFNL
jgi:predicted HTH domain antitoxin